MTYAPQSSPALRWLPACALFIGTALAPAVAAQNRQRITEDAGFTKAPREQVIGTLIQGAEVSAQGSQGNWTQVGLEGWVFSRSLAPANREGFDLVVTRKPTENLRQLPGGPILARLNSGALLSRVETRSGWTHVRRVAWVPSRVLHPVDAAAPASSGAGDRAELVKNGPFLSVAEGEPLGTLMAGTPARVLTRSGNWVRIQVDGWVPDSALKLTDDRVLVGVTQAEVRADPARYTGQVVEWRVQFLAIQRADELRPEIPPGSAYLLTRGPLPEPGFVYVILPPEKLAQFRTLPPLQELVIRATVRSPTTKYLANPVVELVTVEKGL